MSVIIADLAKRVDLKVEMAHSLPFKWLFTNFYVRMEAYAY